MAVDLGRFSCNLSRVLSLAQTRFNFADEFDPSHLPFLHAQASLLSQRAKKKYKKQWEKDFSFWCIFGL